MIGLVVKTEDASDGQAEIIKKIEAEFTVVNKDHAKNW